MPTNKEIEGLLNLEKIISEAMLEDIASGDATTLSIIAPDQMVDFLIVNRENLILCGGDLIQYIFSILDPEVQITKYFNDGDDIKAGQTIAKGRGKAQAVLTLERLMLNLLQQLCGVATRTRQYVELVKHTKAKIRDTRKTIPLLRDLQKYAVRIGGGVNHRSSLDEMIMIKDNHIALSGGIVRAFNKAKDLYPDKIIEIECDTLEQVSEALLTACDIILLDNMSIEMLEQAVELVGGRVQLEASGGIALHNVKAVAETGVEYIAVGDITHSIKASDIGLDVI